MTSCFRFNGRIIIKNDSANHLRILTNPIISSSTGGWENGIHYYNKDSIIWSYGSRNDIKAKIIQPNYWKREDSIYAQTRVGGYHFGDYSLYHFDTAVNGIYEMYPNSSFTIGNFNTKKKIVPTKGSIDGRFDIHKLIVYKGQDSLIAIGDKEIWVLLLSLDKNTDNFNKDAQRRKIRHWIVSIKE